VPRAFTVAPKGRGFPGDVVKDRAAVERFAMADLQYPEAAM
jgi:hypothetical protein